MPSPPESTDSAPTSSKPTPTANGLRQVAAGLLLLGGMGAGIGFDRIVLDARPPSSDLAQSSSFDILSETYDVIRDRYVLSDEISDEDLIEGAASGMINALGDTNHSRYLTAEEAHQFTQSTRGELIGIGVNLDVSALPLRVIMPIPGSPAQEAGILAGDIILAIDGVELSTLSTPQDAVALIRGEEGTDVTLLVQHEGASEPVEYTLTRTTVIIHPVTWAMLPNDVLWVRIDQFSAGTADGLRMAIMAGQSAGATGLVLDLRANPGGLVSEAVSVASMLQPSGSVLFQQENAEGTTSVTTQESDVSWTGGPMVVLIDGDSASAAEIVAASLSENGHATLIGETSSGTGTVLLPVQLEDGSIVLIGTDLWLTPSGKVIWHNGVTPAEIVSLPDDVLIAQPSQFANNEVPSSELQASGDSQLLAALQAVEEQSEGTPATQGATPAGGLSATPVASPQATPQAS